MASCVKFVPQICCDHFETNLNIITAVLSNNDWESLLYRYPFNTDPGSASVSWEKKVVTKKNAVNKFTRGVSILIILTHPEYDNLKQISHLKYKCITIFLNFKHIIILCLGFRRIFVLFSTLPGFLKTLSHLFPMP